MSRTVCGDCWAPYDDAGRCECEEPALRRMGLPYCERSCEANAFQIEIRRLTGEVRMLQQQNTEQDRALVEMEHALNEADAIMEEVSEETADAWRKRWGYLWGRRA